MNVTLNSLLDEVLVLIFRKFDLLEKLKLRQVCLRWKRLIEEFRIRDVSIVDGRFNTGRSWTCIGLESVNYQNLIYYGKPWLNQQMDKLFGAPRSEELTGSLRFVSRHQMFSGLKSMFISFRSIRNFCFQKHINLHFGQLEELSCHHLRLRETCLSLPNLRILSLQLRIVPAGGRIRLDLPNMYKFVTCSSLDLFEFVYPQSVTHLFAPDDHESISRLSNLQYLCCSWMLHESATFSNLDKLKEIHFNVAKKSELKLDAIYRTKQRLGRFELRMFVRQVDYQAYRHCTKSPLTEAIWCYSQGMRISSPVVSFLPDLVFDDLLEAFGGLAIPAELKSSLSNVRRIVTSGRAQENVNAFLQLLCNYPNLHCLELKSPFDGRSDEQACYNSLPFCCRFVRVVSIRRDSTAPIDLNFVLGFSYLQKIQTNLSVRPNFIRSLFEQLKYFRVLELGAGNKITKINFLLTQPFTLLVNRKNPLTLLGSALGKISIPKPGEV